MGKIEVEFMGRHVGAFGHEAHVAKDAGIDHRLEIPAFDGIEFSTVRIVDEVEQARERIAERETPPAAMTDIENPAELGIEFFGIVEIWILPIYRVARRRPQTTFAHDPFSRSGDLAIRFKKKEKRRSGSLPPTPFLKINAG
jgi:hypothetical protein